jgi:hypothetical protein
VVAGQIIEILAAVFRGGSVLPHDFPAFLVRRRPLVAREIANIQGDVPVEGWPTFAAALL